MQSLTRNRALGTAIAVLVLVVVIGAFVYLRASGISDAPTPPANSVYYKGRMAADDVSEARDPTKHKHPASAVSQPANK